jgi:hypothetical protein
MLSKRGCFKRHRAFRNILKILQIEALLKFTDFSTLSRKYSCFIQTSASKAETLLDEPSMVSANSRVAD